MTSPWLSFGSGLAQGVGGSLQERQRQKTRELLNEQAALRQQRIWQENQEWLRANPQEFDRERFDQETAAQIDRLLQMEDAGVSTEKADYSGVYAGLAVDREERAKEKHKHDITQDEEKALKDELKELQRIIDAGGKLNPRQRTRKQHINTLLGRAPLTDPQIAIGEFASTPPSGVKQSKAPAPSRAVAPVSKTRATKKKQATEEAWDLTPYLPDVQ